MDVCPWGGTYQQKLVPYYVLWIEQNNVDLVVSLMEVRTKELGSQDFQGVLGTIDMELMCNMTKPLWVTVKTYIMANQFMCVKRVGWYA